MNGSTSPSFRILILYYLFAGHVSVGAAELPRASGSREACVRVSPGGDRWWTRTGTGLDAKTWTEYRWDGFWHTSRKLVWQQLSDMTDSNPVIPCNFKVVCNPESRHRGITPAFSAGERFRLSRQISNAVPPYQIHISINGWPLTKN